MSHALPRTGATPSCSWIEVSPALTMVLGNSANGDFPRPDDAVMVTYSLGGKGDQSSVRFGCQSECAQGLTLFVARDAFFRLGSKDSGDVGAFHLGCEMRSIVRAIRDGAVAPAMAPAYRIAKSLELLCETIAQLSVGKLVPLAGEGDLSLDDARRVIAARELIDERWHEKLTLDGIARTCGINRTKLTRGFRDMFDCTIAEALAERRLDHARQMLLTTDQPVSSIGYANGYLNNASFARAFSRRYGVAPSSLRQGVAA